MSELNNSLAERFDYLKKNPSAFMEEICGIKLSAWQRYILDNMSKYDPTPRKPMRRWNFYLELCWKYSRMNDNEYVVIASPKKLEKLSKAELLEYIENYWK